MAKYFGKVGFSIQEKTKPGVVQETIVERPYKGDVVTNVHRWENGESLNDNFQVQNQISILADLFAYQNLHYIRYVTYMGSKWKVRSVDIQRPRLILSIGDVYNEQKTPGVTGAP